jgi:hypothetical protein
VNGGRGLPLVGYLRLAWMNAVVLADARGKLGIALKGARVLQHSLPVGSRMNVEEGPLGKVTLGLPVRKHAEYL